MLVIPVDVEECCRRVAARVGHPTISDGQPNAAAIVRSFANRWSPPGSESEALAEGYGRFVRVGSAREVEALLIRLGVDPAAVPTAAQVAVRALDRSTCATDPDQGKSASSLPILVVYGACFDWLRVISGLGLVRTRSAQERTRREAAELAKRAAEVDEAAAEAELVAVRRELAAVQG